jgi:hypothetical protein
MLDDESTVREAEDINEDGVPALRVRDGRGRLGGTFLDAVQADFGAHGAAVVARIREEKPEAYLKLVSSILPKVMNTAPGCMDGLSDEELIERIRALDAVIRPLLEPKKTRSRRPGRPARAGGLSLRPRVKPEDDGDGQVASAQDTA